GQVRAEDDGSPLPGVTVQVKGKKIAAMTDENGQYAIAASGADVLIFTSIGFQTQEIQVNGRQAINLQLKSSSSQLDEVVVVGYGTQTRAKLTSSIAKLDNKVLETGIRSNPAQALAGTIP